MLALACCGEVNRGWVFCGDDDSCVKTLKGEGDFDDDDEAMMAEMADDELVAAVPEPATKEDTISNNRGFVQAESAKAKEVEAFQAKKEEIATVEVDASTLPLVQNASGEKGQ